MKRNLYTFLCWIVLLPAVSAQSLYEYYAPGKQRRQYTEWLNQKGATISERWYLGAEGFLRTDKSTLDNSFNGLIQTNKVVGVGGSVLLGYSYRDRWAFEGGYARSPIHTYLEVNNSPYSFHLKNGNNALLLRARRLLLATNKIKKGSGLWVSAGAWLVPKSGEVRSSTAFRGYDFAYQAHPMRSDNWMLTPPASVKERTTGLAELGLEYSFRLSDWVELGLFGRQNWGLGKALTSTMVYSDKTQAQVATIHANGQGTSVGMAIRYTYTAKRKAVSSRSMFDLQGKGLRKF